MRQPIPSHTRQAVRGQLMLQFSSRLIRYCPAGLACNTLFQVLYTVPRWQALVTEHLHGSGTPAWYAVALLLSFGAYYNVHK